MEEEKLEFGMTKLIIDDDKPQPITDNINIEEEFLKPTKLAYEEDQKNLELSGIKVAQTQEQNEIDKNINPQEEIKEEKIEEREIEIKEENVIEDEKKEVNENEEKNDDKEAEKEIKKEDKNEIITSENKE